MFDRTAIMKDAWAIARRFAGNGQSLRARLSHGLKTAWGRAKFAAEVSASVARSAADQARRIEGQSLAALRERIAQLELTDRLGVSGMARLAQAQDDYRLALALAC